MKKTAIFILRYALAAATFFAGGACIALIIAIATNNFGIFSGSLCLQALALSTVYAATCPITFSVRHFVRLSMLTRLLLQTVVNYPILIAFAWLFG